MVTPIPALTIINTNPLPYGMVGAPYHEDLAASGGVPPYTWSVIATDLPAGLVLDTNSWAIAGIPTNTNAETATFSVELTDSIGTSTNKEFSLTIIPPLTITTTNPLPNGTVGVQYDQTLEATGGSGNYKWSLASDNDLPDRLGVDPYTGTIGGTPTEAGTTSFQVQVMDDNGVTTNKTFTLTITNSPVIILTTSPLPTGTVGVGYGVTFEAAGGLKPYTWSFGSLPDGLLPDSSGAITGIPTTASIAAFQVQVTDSKGASANQSFSLTITNLLGGSSSSNRTWTITRCDNPSGADGGNATLVVSNGVAVRLIESPKPCYSFVNWTEGGRVVSTSSSYSFTATTNRSLVANFTQSVFTISTSSSPAYGGTTSGGGTVTCHSSVTVTAMTNSGFNFLNWTEGGKIVSASSKYTFTATTNRTLVANFKDVQPPSIVITSPPPGQVWGDGNFTASGTATDNVAVATVQYRLNGGAWTSATGTTNWTITDPNVFLGTNLFQVCAADTTGNWSATNNMGFVYVYALPLQVPLNYLPRATQNAPYSTKLQTIGGAPPYIWSLAPGSAGLPSGLSLASSGVISGIPSAPGTNYFMVNVTDAMNTTTNQVLTLTVNASSLPPVISITGPTNAGEWPVPVRRQYDVRRGLHGRNFQPIWWIGFRS